MTELGAPRPLLQEVAAMRAGTTCHVEGTEPIHRSGSAFLGVKEGQTGHRGHLDDSCRLVAVHPPSASEGAILPSPSGP